VGSRPVDESPLSQSRQVAGGSEGPLRPLHFWGIWSFQEQAGGKEPAGAPVAAEGNPKDSDPSGGHDLPAFDNLTTLKTWADEGPPKGTLYHYPNRYNHQILSIAAQPAPPKIAVQIYSQGLMTQMTVRHMQDEPLEKTLAWAEDEVEGYLRT
jgi:hypothetical protein